MKGNDLRRSGPSRKKGQRACKNCLSANCTNPSSCYWHPHVCQNHKTEWRCTFGDQCLFRLTEVDGQPNKMSKKSGGEGSGALFWRSENTWVAYSRMQSRRNRSRFYRKSTTSLGSDRIVRFSKGTLHHLQSRERKGPSQGYIQKCAPHERGPDAPKFEERTQEKALGQERCARRGAWDLAKHVYKLNEKDKATFF